jgi:hypothetical protein
LAELRATAWSGALNYSVPLSPKMRLVAKVSGVRQKADDPLIDLATYRAGRTGVTQSFDYTRYSSLDRTVTRASAELITRMNPKATVSLLAGYERTDRDDYPVVDDGIVSSKLIGQARVRYNKGPKYAVSLKYRFENTSDPCSSGRGLFESPGRQNQELWRQLPGFAFIFYYQREDLRYQAITTAPTMAHSVDWSSTYRPDAKTTLNLGVKGSIDKNGDLDSIDVKHFLVQPNLAVTYTPDARWSVTAGYTYDYSKSRGPVSVALFDG